MARKTKAELHALNTPPEPGTEAYWRLEGLKARAMNSMQAAKHRKIMIDIQNGDLIRKDEVKEMFSRVFGAYRQCIKEMERRYGPDAAKMMINAERSALRVQKTETKLGE